MKRRKDYSKFKEILEKYQIKKFYHFTDRSNIESIIKNGGLYSWGDCLKKGIYVPHPGGSELSHELDSQQNLAEYARISICKRHPMMYYAMNEGRIVNPVILEIDTDILFLDGNVFSDKNAVRADANKGTSFSYFESIHFRTALRNTQFDVDEDEKDYFQAEILVKNYIPLHYITNISNFVEQDIHSTVPRVKVPYSAPITEDNPAVIFFILNQSYPTDNKIVYKGKEETVSQAISDIVNQQLHSLITQNTEDNNLHNRYQISVIGYGDYVYNCFNGNLRYKNFVELEELKENPLSLKKTIKEKKTRQGIIQIERDEPVWITPKNDGNAYLHKALNRVKNLAEKWISLHPSSFPPIIIHISCFGYNGTEDYDIIQLANEIKSLYTQDGNTIFANLIFSQKTEEKPVLFPKSVDEMGKSVFGEMYYLMSSQLPLLYNQQIRDYRDEIDIESFHSALAFNITINDIPVLLHTLIQKAK